MVLKLSRPVVLLLISGLAFTIILVHSQDQSGFISIDCGLSKGSSYTDDKSLYYVSDDGFIDTGTNMDISPIHLSGYRKQLTNLRSFPHGIKNCYTLRPAHGQGTNYLVRATFVYGNYDSKNSTPEFDVHLGTDVWFTVKFDPSDDFLSREIIYTPSEDYLYVCLVNTGHGTPFISLLELRQLNTTIYSRISWSLDLVGRFYTYTGTSYGIRYKDDMFDRIWQAENLDESTTISTTSDVDSSSDLYRLPSLVMKAATTVKNKNDPLVIPLDILVPVDGNSTSQFYIYLHFAEVLKLSANETREFTINLNGELYIDPYSPTYLVAGTVAHFLPISGSGINITLKKTARSTLPPIINALEYFMVKELFQALTNNDDVDAVYRIKSTYSLSKNWQGDPCLPRSYMWDGVNCSFTNLNTPNIIRLDLSSSGLTGNISPSFSNLTSLQILDLSNNSLTGVIPESLAGLPSLRILDLSMNKLTGSVPQVLLEKEEKGQLTLSLSSNSDLCLSSTCTPRKKKSFVVPVVASIGAFIGLVVVLGILYLIKARKSAGPKTTTKQNKSVHQLAYHKNNKGIKQYSYSEVIDMTKGFERELGKGGFGSVYYGCLKDGTEVAVKKLHSKLHGLEQFETEIELLMTIHHKNLVCLLGYCDEGENLVLICEYMVNGNLQSFLSANDSETWKQRLKIAIGAAQGLDYLHHGCRPPIVHRDVKTCNILLDEKFEAKVADFGVSKIFPDDYKSHVSTRVIGTPGYLDPEYIITEQLNEKSDVYSFGVVLLELITGQSAVIKSTTTRMSLVDKVRTSVEKWDVWSIVDPRVKESIHNQNSVWRLIDVAMACVNRSSIERPTMSHIVTDLNECLGMEMDDATSQESYSRIEDSTEMMNFAVPTTAMNPKER